MLDDPYDKSALMTLLQHGKHQNGAEKLAEHYNYINGNLYYRKNKASLISAIFGISQLDDETNLDDAQV